VSRWYQPTRHSTSRACLPLDQRVGPWTNALAAEMAEHEHVAVNVREVPVAQPADAPQQPPSSTPPPTDESMRASRAFEHKDQGK